MQEGNYGYKTELQCQWDSILPSADCKKLRRNETGLRSFCLGLSYKAWKWVEFTFPHDKFYYLLVCYYLLLHFSPCQNRTMTLLDIQRKNTCETSPSCLSCVSKEKSTARPSTHVRSPTRAVQHDTGVRNNWSGLFQAAACEKEQENGEKIWSHNHLHGDKSHG